MGLDTKIDWLTDRQSQCDFDFDFDLDENIRVLNFAVVKLTTVQMTKLPL
jgi:hypothetical protein